MAIQNSILTYAICLTFLLFPKICESQVSKLSSQRLNDCIIENATYFLNTPYKSGTLDNETKEELVCINDQFDCVTFVEYILALSIYQLNFDNNKTTNFESALTKIRYRDGKINGYGSRLHYFTEWIEQQKDYGILIDVTPELGGLSYQKTINFMSSNKNKYPSLKNPDDLNKILKSEQLISTLNRFYIPKNKVKEIIKEIQSGDIIAITTTINGLDISHTGFAIKVDGVIHLLHASETEKKVVISKNNLHHYLSDNNKQSGIIILRPKY
jgi:hypothetical protein